MVLLTVKLKRISCVLGDITCDRGDALILVRYLGLEDALDTNGEGCDGHVTYERCRVVKVAMWHVGEVYIYGSRGIDDKDVADNEAVGQISRSEKGESRRPF